MNQPALYTGEADLRPSDMAVRLDFGLPEKRSDGLGFLGVIPVELDAFLAEVVAVEPNAGLKKPTGA